MKAGEWNKEEMRRMIEEEKRKLEELAAKNPAQAVQAIIGFYKGLGYTSEQVNEILKPKEEVGLQEEKTESKPELPEGVEVVKYEFVLESDAITAENLFSVIIAKKGEFRSAVNLGTKVRTVMYELDKEGKAIGGGSALVMETVSKDNAWHLQQMIDWAYRTIVEIIAVKRINQNVEVAFMMKGLKVIKPEEKEKLFYRFKKSDGYKLEGESKR